MTRDQMRETADRIAAEHGCEILPRAFGGRCVQLARRYQGAGVDSVAAASRCLQAIRAAGVNTYRWVV